MNLDDLRKIAENATFADQEDMTAGFDDFGGFVIGAGAVLALLDRVETAEQALQRVRDRHQPCLSCLEPHCFVCEKAKWPCAEFRALEGDE